MIRRRCIECGVEMEFSDGLAGSAQACLQCEAINWIPPLPGAEGPPAGPPPHWAPRARHKTDAPGHVAVVAAVAAMFVGASCTLLAGGAGLFGWVCLGLAAAAAAVALLRRSARAGLLVFSWLFLPAGLAVVATTTIRARQTSVLPPDPRYKTYAAPDGSFSADLPRDYKMVLETEGAATESGRLVPVKVYSAPVPDSKHLCFGVGVMPSAHLGATGAGDTWKAQAEYITEGAGPSDTVYIIKKVERPGGTVARALGRTVVDGTPFDTVQEVYLLRGHLISAVALTGLGEKEKQGPHVKRFFESFRPFPRARRR